MPRSTLASIDLVTKRSKPASRQACSSATPDLPVKHTKKACATGSATHDQDAAHDSALLRLREAFQRRSATSKRAVVSTRRLASADNPLAVPSCPVNRPSTPLIEIGVGEPSPPCVTAPNARWSKLQASTASHCRATDTDPFWRSRLGTSPDANSIARSSAGLGNNVPRSPRVEVSIAVVCGRVISDTQSGHRRIKVHVVHAHRKEGIGLLHRLADPGRRRIYEEM